MYNIVALYRGTSLETGHLIGSTCRPDIVQQVASVLYPVPHLHSSDHVIGCLEDALIKALKQIEEEANIESGSYALGYS